MVCVDSHRATSTPASPLVALVVVALSLAHEPVPAEGCLPKPIPPELRPTNDIYIF